jgi:hypothetical protein
MWRKLPVSVLILLLGFSISAQESNGFRSFFEQRKKMKMVRTGPYISLQQGRYLVPEFGAERQWTQVKLKDPHTHAAHMGFNYNIRYGVLGYDVGYWFKTNRIGLTYGGNLCFRTDFSYSRVGFAPVLGFKLWQFHLQTGFHFLTRSAVKFETNTYFASLRFVIVNDRDLKRK